MKSIIIPTLGRPPHLDLLLRSLIREVASTDEILLIDDAIPAQEFSSENETNRPIRHLRTDSGFGFAAAVNTGLRQAKGDFLYIVNADTIADAGVLTQLADLLEREKGIGVAAPLLLYPQTNRIQHAGLAFSETNHCHFYAGAPPETLPSSPLYPQAIAFAFCCLRTETIRKTGLLDTRYINGYEDLDYCFKLRERTLKIVVLPQLKSWHWEKHTGQTRSLHRKDNVIRLWSKWGSKIQADLHQYVGTSLSRCLQSNEEPYGFLDLSYGLMRTEALRAISSSKIQFIDRWHFPQRVSPSREIDLALKIPYHIGRFPNQLLILVDQLEQLAHNQYWFALRHGLGADDLLIDLLGKCCRGRDLVRYLL